MIPKLNFYTTEGCHLCEEAKGLLESVLIQHPNTFCVHYIDIVESEQLVEKYGVRIPVLEKVDDSSEIGWPFNQGALVNFLAL